MLNVEEKRRSLASIAVQLPELPRLARMATSLAARFKPTVAAALERVCELARWLYIQEEYSLALQACQVLHDVPFAGDYNKWTWVENSLCLEWKLFTKANQPLQAQECLALLQAVNVFGTSTEQQMKVDALQNRLAGCLLKGQEIVEAELFADKALAQAWRFAQVGELLYMQAHGGSTTWPLALLEQQLVADVLLLRSSK